MLLYLFVILLVNTGPSFGLPVEQKPGNGTIRINNLLSELAKGCKNELVTSIINSKLEECNLGIPPSFASSIRCSMFYDASAVLCNFTTNTPKLATDFKAKTNTKQDLSKFCDEAAQLIVPAIRFQKNITEVLHKDTACTIVCADSDIMSGDTSFYCKYYKWMLEIVHSQVTPLINTPKGGQVAIDGQNKLNDTLANTDAASALEDLPKKDEIKETSSDNNNRTSANAVDTNQLHVEGAQPESSLPTSTLKKGSNITETALDNKKLENGIHETQLNKSDDKLDKKGTIHLENVLEDTALGRGIESPKSLNGGLDGEEEEQGSEREGIYVFIVYYNFCLI